MSPFILFGLLYYLLSVAGSIYLIYIDWLPTPEYQKRTEPINIWSLCEKIKDSQFQEVCFTIAEDKDFERGLVLMIKTEDDLARAQGYFIERKDEEKYLNNRLEHFPGYYYSGIYGAGRPSSPSLRKKGVKELVAEGAGYNSADWCREFFTFNGNLWKEEYYLCRAFLENPHFCKKILSDLSEIPKDKMKRLCYEDAAKVWKDPFLCEKSLNQDVCYLELALQYLKDQEKKIIQ
ncbi:MAG: hypothetical protein WBC21_01860 [Minisyncoccales bacterium]